MAVVANHAALTSIDGSGNQHRRNGQAKCCECVRDVPDGEQHQRKEQQRDKQQQGDFEKIVEPSLARVESLHFTLSGKWRNQYAPRRDGPAWVV